MTDQSTLSTEAGRAVWTAIAEQERLSPNGTRMSHYRSGILAIEEQARADGRREAALTISAELQHYDRSDDPGYITVPTERVRAILSPLAGRVAGLDASEHPGEYEIDGMDGGTYRFSGDASDE